MISRVPKRHWNSWAPGAGRYHPRCNARSRWQDKDVLGTALFSFVPEADRCADCHRRFEREMRRMMSPRWGG